MDTQIRITMQQSDIDTLKNLYPEEKISKLIRNAVKEFINSNLGEQYDVKRRNSR